MLPAGAAGALCLLPVVVVGLASAQLGPHREHEHSPESATRGRPPRALLRPQRRTLTRVVEQPSFVSRLRRTSIYPKMTAYIEKWNVDIGDKVQKGDVLATLYVPELVEQWRTKKATVTLDKKRISLAKKLVRVAEAEVKAATALGGGQGDPATSSGPGEPLGRRGQAAAARDGPRRGRPQILLESQNQLEASTRGRGRRQGDDPQGRGGPDVHAGQPDEAAVAVKVASANLAVAESDEKRLAALNRLPRAAGAVRRRHLRPQRQHLRLRAAEDR